VPEIVDAAERFDPRRLLRRAPVERPEVVDVEVAATLAGKQKRRAVAVVDPVERVDARACSGTARVLASVFGIFSSPRVKERRTYTTCSLRSMSRRSSAIHSAGRSPVAAAKRTIGP
jgi:hypothetical protein